MPVEEGLKSGRVIYRGDRWVFGFGFKILVVTVEEKERWVKIR